MDLRARGNFAPAAVIASRIAGAVREGGLPSGVFLNVNVPAGTADAVKGLRVAKQSVAIGTERFDEARSAYEGSHAALEALKALR